MNLNFSSTNTNQLNPLGDEGAGEVCIANISPKERKKRLKISIQVFLFTLLILGSLLVLDLNPLWRLPLFFMFATSATTFFQWRDKT